MARTRLQSWQERRAPKTGPLPSPPIAHLSLKHGDMYQLPFMADSFDIALLHLVLHHAEQPLAVLRESARIIAPNGMLVIVDFASHDREELRRDFAHRRLGFTQTEMADWLKSAGLHPRPPLTIAGHALTVHIWQAYKP
jgi:SAM-dependent methyltransferase